MKSTGWKGLVLAMCTIALAGFAQQPPDFSRRDVNDNSIRFGQMVSPRDYLLQASGYYFGTAG